MKRKLTLALLSLIVGTFLASTFGWFKSFPAGPLKAVTNDPAAILYSLDGSEPPHQRIAPPGAPRFHDWPILGQTVLMRDQDRDRVAAILSQAARGAWDKAACFNPRHGIRATDSTGTYDVVLCFECGQAVLYSPGGQTQSIAIHGKPDALNELLTAAKVTLAPTR